MNVVARRQRFAGEHRGDRVHQRDVHRLHIVEKLVADDDVVSSINKNVLVVRDVGVGAENKRSVLHLPV